MAVTIKDVAALAGVSPSTVSRTCKNNPSISDETKERVRQAMKKLGYEPNFQASNLASQNSRTIGIILPPSKKEAYENSFYLEMIRGISQFCNKRQYASTIITGEDEDELIQVVQTMIRGGQVDGFILLFSRQQDAVIDYLCEEGVLYVLIGKANQFINQTIYIDNDNLMGGQEATEYLIKLGHEKIAFIGSDSNLIYSTDRKNGYQLALVQHRMPILPEYCVELLSLSHDSFEPIRELLELPDPPTAVVVSDDILAVLVEHTCLSLGVSIPDDLSIISFNNSLISRLTSPQLTSIDVNSFQLGIEAASQMINHIENPNLLAAKIIVPHYLIERQSCKKLK
ncbi:MAG: LacI family DNA-binding transcriptional regulator [Lachnospiraceae bacterium]